MIDAILGRFFENYERFINDEATRTMMSYKDFISSGIPAVSQISLAFKKIEAYSKNQNLDSLNQALLNMMSVLMPSEEWNIDRLRQLAERIDYREIENAYHEIENEQPVPQPAPGPNIGGVPEQQQAEDLAPVYDEQYQQQQIQQILNNLSPAQMDEVYNNIRVAANNPFANEMDGIDYDNIINDIDNDIDNAGVAEWRDLEEHQKRVILTSALQNNNYILGNMGIHGLGLVKAIFDTCKAAKRGRGRPKGSGIRKKYSEVLANSIREGGIEPDRRFIKFGRYLINTKKLNDGILAIKCLSGNGIAEFPSQRVSNNLRKVVKTMIGGGNPSFSDLEALSEPERIYLHKLASKADIVDKFNIPTPSKTKYEQDIHDFEVMKGEIMSGNDSKELVKKFKLHILKLSKMGALPKSEVQDILETLVELGY